MSMGRHKCSKTADNPTFSAQWSGVSFAPHCNHNCPECGEQLHHEGDSHYCPQCDDFQPKPKGCTFEWNDPDRN